MVAAQRWPPAGLLHLRPDRSLHNVGSRPRRHAPGRRGLALAAVPPDVWLVARRTVGGLQRRAHPGAGVVALLARDRGTHRPRQNAAARRRPAGTLAPRWGAPPVRRP